MTDWQEVKKYVYISALYAIEQYDLSHIVYLFGLPADPSQNNALVYTFRDIYVINTTIRYTNGIRSYPIPSIPDHDDNHYIERNHYISYLISPTLSVRVSISPLDLDTPYHYRLFIRKIS